MIEELRHRRSKPPRKRIVFRLMLHIPVGLFTVFALYVHWSLGLVMSIGFLTYEVTENWRIHDYSYVDLSGFLWGIALGTVGWWLII